MDERERLIEIMKSQGLNSKRFSQELGVSAGTISNIIGGRNKPSHEFLQAVARQYPFISRDWLFMGEGEMRKAGCEPKDYPVSNPDLFSQIEENTTISTQKRLANDLPSIVVGQAPLVNTTLTSRTVQKIVIFYSDGTFEER